MLRHGQTISCPAAKRRSLTRDAVGAERFRRRDAVDPRIGVITDIVITTVQLDFGRFDLLCFRAGMEAELDEEQNNRCRSNHDQITPCSPLQGRSRAALNGNTASLLCNYSQ